MIKCSSNNRNRPIKEKLSQSSNFYKQQTKPTSVDRSVQSPQLGVCSSAGRSQLSASRSLCSSECRHFRSTMTHSTYETEYCYHIIMTQIRIVPSTRHTETNFYSTQTNTNHISQTVRHDSSERQL